MYVLINKFNMKSKVIKMTFWAFFAVIGSSTVYSYQQSVQMSDLLLINVEALADSEQTGSEGCVQDPNLVCVIRILRTLRRMLSLPMQDL